MKVSVGDLLVRFGKILCVSRVRADEVILRPFFEAEASHGLVYSIPSRNLNNNSIRKLVSPHQLQELWDSTFKQDSVPAEIDVVESRSSLNLNCLEDSLPLIKTLWSEKQAHAGYLPGGRLSLLQQALTQAAEEIAAVKGILPREARILVLSALKKGSRVLPPSSDSA